jgi:hypothetical protein
MNSSFITVMWLGVITVYVIHKIRTTLVKKKFPSEIAPETLLTADTAGSVVPAQEKWFPVPGERLELGSTGFYIELVANDQEPPYRGYSPEGYQYGRSRELSAMKDYLEARARERAEFDAPKAELPGLNMKGQAS